MYAFVWSVFTHVASIYANLLEQKKALAKEKNATPRGLVWDTNMAAVSLFRDTNMAAVTSCENTLLAHALCVELYLVFSRIFRTEFVLYNPSYTKAAKRSACMIEIILTNEVRNIRGPTHPSQSACSVTAFILLWCQLPLSGANF